MSLWRNLRFTDSEEPEFDAAYRRVSSIASPVPRVQCAAGFVVVRGQGRIGAGAEGLKPLGSHSILRAQYLHYGGGAALVDLADNVYTLANACPGSMSHIGTPAE
jgi:hypothetical protein